MARKNKQGLEYFSHDVDLSTDEKIQILQADHKLEGYAVYIKLIERIYRNGYYILFDDRQLKIFSMNNNIDIEKTFNIINTCLDENLFSKNLYKKYQILTSSGIQTRFCEAIIRRKSFVFDKRYLLIKIDVDNLLKNVDIEYLNVDIEPLNVDINSQRKGKESKGKESKENIFRNNLYNILKIRTKQKEDVKELLKDFEIDVLIQVMNNWKIYKKGANKRNYSFSCNWKNFYEKIGLFEDIEAVNELIEKENKSNNNYSNSQPQTFAQIDKKDIDGGAHWSEINEPPDPFMIDQNDDTGYDIQNED